MMFGFLAISNRRSEGFNLKQVFSCSQYEPRLSLEANPELLYSASILVV